MLRHLLRRHTIAGGHARNWLTIARLAVGRIRVVPRVIAGLRAIALLYWISALHVAHLLGHATRRNKRNLSCALKMRPTLTL